MWVHLHRHRHDMYDGVCVSASTFVVAVVAVNAITDTANIANLLKIHPMNNNCDYIYFYQHFNAIKLYARPLCDQNGTRLHTTSLEN